MLWSLSGGFARSILQLVTLMVLARLLSPADFGVLAASSSLILLVELLRDLGIVSALVQKPNLNPHALRVGFILSLIIGILLFISLYLSADYIENFFLIDQFSTVVKLLSFTVIVSSLSAVSYALCLRELRFRDIAAIQLVGYFIGFVCVAIPMAFYGNGFWSLITGSIVQSVTSALMLIALRPPSISLVFSWKEAKELLTFGTGHTLTAIANYLANQGDRVIIARYLGAEALGEYSRAYQLVIMPINIFGDKIVAVLFPAVAQAQSDPSRVARAYKASLMGACLVSLPTSVLIAVLAPEIVLLILGPKWGEAVPVLQILSAGVLFRVGQKVADGVAKGAGAAYRRAWRQMVYALLVLVAALVGQGSGTIGVAAGVLVALAINFLLMTGLCNKLTGLRWRENVAALSPAIRVTCLLGICVWAVSYALRAHLNDPYITLIASVIAALFSLLFAFRLMPAFFLGEEGKNLLLKVTQSLPRAPQKYIKVILNI